MKHKFLFSVFVIFFILVFIALGSWQIIRLDWKNNLILEIENSLKNPPVELNQSKKENYLKTNNKGNKKDNILDRDYSKEVLDMMRDVVHSKDGTGRKAKVEGYTVYGKTGTVRQIINGKYAKDKHNALFIGIVGDPEPKYVVAVIVRSPKNREGSGGFHAAPVFSEFMQHSMRILSDMSYVNTRQ